MSADLKHAAYLQAMDFASQHSAQNIKSFLLRAVSCIYCFCSGFLHAMGKGPDISIILIEQVKASDHRYDPFARIHIHDLIDNIVRTRMRAAVENDHTVIHFKNEALLMSEVSGM